jgi:hypothetical protein
MHVDLGEPPVIVDHLTGTLARSPNATAHYSCVCVDPNTQRGRLVSQELHAPRSEEGECLGLGQRRHPRDDNAEVISPKAVESRGVALKVSIVPLGFELREQGKILIGRGSRGNLSLRRCAEQSYDCR